MKKILTLALALLLALSLAACSGNSKPSGSTTTPPASSSTPPASQGADNTPSSNGSGNVDYTVIKTGTAINAADWQKYLEANFDLDMTVPDEWTYKEGKIANINPAFDFRFTTSSGDKQAAYDALTAYLFELTAKTSDAGNFTLQSISEKIKGDKLDSVPAYAPWYFTTSKGTVQITISGGETEVAQVYFVFIGELN